MDATLASQPPAAPPPPAPLVPVATNQRIEALDVVRGFALLGIFLMNIEWFNRPWAAFGEGIPRDATGADWWATWFVNYFVQGKFWSIFSLLFGMGFAVMLVRAERAGRDFIKVYLRRILALAVFGAVHFIYLWHGDILFSYAAGALGLLIVMYGRARPIGIGVAVLIGLGFVAEPFFGVAAGLTVMGLLALYLRGEKKLRWRGRALPVFSFILMLVGTLMAIAAAVLWVLPDAPTGPRGPLSVFGPMLFITGWLSWKYHDPAEKRALRMAVSIYVFAGVSMVVGSLLQHFTPDPAALGAGADKKSVATAPAASAAAVATAAPGSAATAASKAKAADKPKKTPEERAAEARAEREKRLKEQAERKAEEIKVLTSGSYFDIVMWQARQFPEKAAGDAGFAVMLVAMFLLGAWFVRSGVMENTAAHLPFFRQLALWGLPIGIGLGLLSTFIGVSHTPGVRTDGWGIARSLVMLGNLPACLGYVGLVVTMLHSRSVFARIGVLAPLGRMALTNYLMQSVICMFFFYGIGLGQWGMPRSHQMVFVAVVYIAQLAFSHWWLARYRYGPMEWLWRGFTYRQVPPLRIAAAPTATPARAA